MDRVGMTLRWPADIVLAAFQKLTDLVKSEVSWMKMNHSSLILEVVVVLEAECVAVAVLLVQ